MRRADNRLPCRKGVSFLSRFIGGGRKKGTHNGSEDDESLEGDLRTEGIDAHVFSQPIGHIPQYPPPPKYIRVRRMTELWVNKALKYLCV